MRVVVLGASGMLGSMVLSRLARHGSLDLVATARDAEQAERIRKAIPCRTELLDAGTATAADLEALVGGGGWIVNCIGVIKPYIKDDNAGQVERAIRVNSLFPHLLADAVAGTGTRVLQIATDCVYSGSKGAYAEADPHDALDVYGKSKSLGEVHAHGVHHLRCSIIGPEPKGHVSLLDWFRGQPRGASVNGFTNHNWNGVTTLHFGKVCHGIITSSLALPHLVHVVPTASITKSDLLVEFAKRYGREDITVKPVAAGTVIDRTLSTSQPELNAAVWAAAGHPTPPTVAEMVAEMAEYGEPF